MDRRKEFKKKLAVIATVAGMTVGGFAVKGAMENTVQNSDLAKYAENDNKYTDYVDSSENEKLEQLLQLDENISRYEELSSKKDLSEEEKDELNNIMESIKIEMKSGSLSRFYLHDVFKEKIRQAYGVDKVTTRYSFEPKDISIKMEKEFEMPTYMDDKDKIKPLKLAMEDIVTLQYYEEIESISEKQVKDFIRIQKNMKGFSNLHFVKTEGQPLVCVEMEKNDEREI